MQKIQTAFLLFLGSLLSLPLCARVEEYGAKICTQKGYQCLKVKHNDSWSKLFPDLEQRMLVMFANRYNGFLKQDMVLAVPEHSDKKSLFDISPMPLHIESYQERVILIHQKSMAWGAYNKHGQLMRWGPISAGSEICPETGSCTTPVGTYRIQRKSGAQCYSHSFPVRRAGDRGGAYMPYCMFFHKGFALHGSADLPGYNASHGCIRLLTEDAQWLNTVFTAVPETTTKGTLVVII